MPDDDTTDRPLVVDEVRERLERFRILSDSDEEASDRLLNELGGSGRVEQEMVQQLAAAHPVAHPDRLPEAHALAMHALEVLARNGARPPSQLRVGPLTPVARFVVQQVIRYIVRAHQSHVVDSIRDLYARRLGWVPTGDPPRLALVRARLDVERSSPSFKQKGGGVPTFLLGGAAVSSLAQAGRTSAGAAAGSHVGLLITIGVTCVLLAASSWAILHAAAIARRRIRLTLDQPLRALWETVGAAGNPPKDNAHTFALVAIVLTVVGWLVIPIGALLIALL